MAETKKVLIIDDEEDFCFFVRENLINTGMFDVFVATNGRYGIKLARQEKPDIILLDLMMPDLTGEEVADELKDYAATAEIPIIFVTALATRTDTGESSLKKTGSAYYISKPVRTRELVGAINEVI
ncbi:MAG: response regulator [Desulfobacterales bacterium]|nr:response regulator [Desulfobacterales bacterium]